MKNTSLFAIALFLLLIFAGFSANAQEESNIIQVLFASPTKVQEEDKKDNVQWQLGVYTSYTGNSTGSTLYDYGPVLQGSATVDLDSWFSYLYLWGSKSLAESSFENYGNGLDLAAGKIFLIGDWEINVSGWIYIIHDFTKFSDDLVALNVATTYAPWKVSLSVEGDRDFQARYGFWTYNLAFNPEYGLFTLGLSIKGHSGAFSHKARLFEASEVSLKYTFNEKLGFKIRYIESFTGKFTEDKAVVETTISF